MVAGLWKHMLLDQKKSFITKNTLQNAICIDQLVRSRLYMYKLGHF